MESANFLFARDLTELHAALALIPRDGKKCVDCNNNEELECPQCDTGEECTYTVPTDCTQCAKSVCVAIDSSSSSSGGSNDSGGGGGNKTNIGAIVGGVVGGLVVVAIVAYLVWRFCVKPKRSEQDSVYYEEARGSMGAEKDGASRITRRSSTHTVHSIASTVLTRASNIIQIAYIPGVTNRATPTSPTVLVPPVPPIPMQHGGTGEEGSGDQHFFVPGALRDSTYSGLSGYSDRTSYATRASYAPRSSIASTIYGKSAQVFTSAQAGLRAKPTMVSVKSVGTGENTPPVPSLDIGRFADSRPKSTASTFSVGSTFLNNASTATAAPVRAQVVKVGSGLKKVEISKSGTSSSASSTVTSVAELSADGGMSNGPPAIAVDGDGTDQGPFSDPPQAKTSTPSTPSLGVVMEDAEEPSSPERKKTARMTVTAIQRGSSPFGDEHATRE